MDCSWCSRPGDVVHVEVRSGEIHLTDPVLCSVCAAGLDLVPYGFADGDERRRVAQNEARQLLGDTRGSGCGWCGRHETLELVGWNVGTNMLQVSLCAICEELLGFGCQHIEHDDPLDTEACDVTLDAVYAYLATIT